MIATGKLPPDALPLELQGSTDCVLGLEFSGHVTCNKGGSTKRRVMGILPAKALATIVTTKPHFTWQVIDCFYWITASFLFHRTVKIFKFC